jgi:hypothetical protein
LKTTWRGVAENAVRADERCGALSGGQRGDAASGFEAGADRQRLGLNDLESRAVAGSGQRLLGAPVAVGDLRDAGWAAHEGNEVVLIGVVRA